MSRPPAERDQEEAKMGSGGSGTDSSSNQEKCRVPSWLEKICQQLLPHSSLTALNLAGKQIGPNGATALAQALHNNGTLQKLILRKNNLGNEGLNEVAEALYQHNTLQELDLSYNEITDVEVIEQLLRRNTSLKKLYLNGNKIGGSDTNMEAIAIGLKANDSLQMLGLHGCGIGSTATLLGKAVCNNTSLRVLDLSRNEIDSPAAMELLRGLEEPSQSRLKVLNLKHNFIGNDGAAALGRVLQVNRTLRTLYLSWNPIESDGTVAFAEGLADNVVLQYLEMYGIAVGRHGAAALRNVLQTSNRTLKVCLIDSFSDEYRLEEAQIDLYCDLNRAGRKFVHDVTLPWSLWPLIISNKVGHNVNLLFVFLREKPELFHNV